MAITAKQFLAAHPICKNCERQEPPVYRRSTHIGLVFPDWELFDETNWIALCDECYEKHIKKQKK